jgi:hypothetical protein
MVSGRTADSTAAFAGPALKFTKDVAGPGANKKFMRLFSMMAIGMFAAVGALAEPAEVLTDAQIQGNDLATRLYYNTRPVESSTNTGVLKIRNQRGVTLEIPTTFAITVAETNWQSVYSIPGTNTNGNEAAWTALVVTHFGDNIPNGYQYYKVFPEPEKHGPVVTNLTDKQIMAPFAGSDFWVADLGLEFFNWPAQKILKKEFSRGRACMVLESVNPDPANGYSRVDSWIDEESYYIVHAEAFDAKGKLLKEFDPKSFKKVNGQWQLQGMEIQNVQKGSRTRIEFDLKK